MPSLIEVCYAVSASLVGSGGVDKWELRLALLFLIGRRSDWRLPALRTSASTLCRASDLNETKLIMSESDHICPGCGLAMPPNDSAAYDGYYNASPECWNLYSEVLAEEYDNAFLYGQVHQLTVDAYAVQHAGGSHPDKSVGIHLTGLYLMLEQDVSPPEVPSFHKQLARSVEEWPRFEPPSPQDEERLTVLEVALAESVEEHIERSREWADQVWNVWTPHHDRVVDLVTSYLDPNVHRTGNPK